jgi:hypothetical protein
MLVRGEGEPIPYTDAFVWHVKDIIAAIEVKKRLHSAELSDAVEHLRSITTLETAYLKQAAAEQPNEPVDLQPALKAFAETTRRVPPSHKDVDQLPIHEQLIYHTLITEQTSAIRIVLGLHGFKSEAAFRRAMVDHLTANVGVEGFGPGSLPQLIICCPSFILQVKASPVVPMLGV